MDLAINQLNTSEISSTVTGIHPIFLFWQVLHLQTHLNSNKFEIYFTRQICSFFFNLNFVFKYDFSLWCIQLLVLYNRIIQIGEFWWETEGWKPRKHLYCEINKSHIMKSFIINILHEPKNLQIFASDNIFLNCRILLY